MKTNTSLALLFAAAVSVSAAPVSTGAPANTIQLPVFGPVKVLDVVDCTKTDHDFVERPAGCSTVETILGRACRHMPVREGDGASMISYRLGKGKGLQPNGSYVVVLDYPDDVPRNYVIFNHATDSHRGFSTGICFGDAWDPAHIDNHNEMISVPQSGKWELWTCYSSLLSWTSPWNGSGGDNPVKIMPEDGFDFVLQQYGRNHDPFSKGIAVSKIMLCEIPDETKCYAKVVLPPDPLPKRHLFWREEMSDGSALQGGPNKRHCAVLLDWIRHKFRQMKMLGMNTYQKDLLEFGHVQHWDPNAIRMNWAWSSDADQNALWGQIVAVATKEYGFDLFPFYEWCGNFGADYDGGKKTYGYRKVCEPLNGRKDYTHIGWSEKGNVDVTDPEALQATKELLDGSILRFKDQAKFMGAMFRTRPAAWPVSFSDATRARFGQEANGGATPSRGELESNKALYDKYIAWWHGKRAAFLKECAEYLRANGIPDAVVILDADASEPGPGLKGVGGLDVVADDPAAVAAAFAEVSTAKKPTKVVPLAEAVANQLYLKGRNDPAGTWGGWEWHHACPADCPAEYPKDKASGLAMPVNRIASVRDPAAFAAYADANGRTTMIRHHSLNEHNMYLNPGSQEFVSTYDMSDSEKAGRASMMVEVEAMAHGDPANIGYLIGSCFARGFPGPAREFNQNFLALPALPSKVVPGACRDPEVTVRRIDAGKFGTYYSIVHTGKTPKKDVLVKLPGAKMSQAIVAGKALPMKGDVVKISLQPWQLLAVRAK